MTPAVRWWSLSFGVVVVVWQPSHAVQWEGVAVAQVVQMYEEDDPYDSLETVFSKEINTQCNWELKLSGKLNIMCPGMCCLPFINLPFLFPQIM